MTAQDILKLIELIDPKDTAKLDEVDAMVHYFLTGKVVVEDSFEKELDTIAINGVQQEVEHYSDVPGYRAER